MWPFTDGYPEVPLGQTSDWYDYIIVGGGTAGCALANRLSADTSKTVLLVERGPRADTWTSRVPLLSADYSSDRARSSRLESTAQEHLNGRVIELVTGSALGGTSRINQMAYTRGCPAEYDRWAKAGRKGWAWKDLEPLFEKSKHGKVQAAGGEWKTRAMPTLYFRPFQVVEDSIKKLGVPYLPDLNTTDEPPFGCGRLSSTIDEGGERHSSYRAFLPADIARKRARNLHICTETSAEKLVIERDAKGDHVVSGVLLTSSAGGKETVKTVNVKKEVIVSSGPFGTPHLLMLSGVGPAEHLREHNITVVKDLPAVGSNLQDHTMLPMDWTVPVNDSLLVLQEKPLRFMFEFMRYMLWGTGLLLAPVVQMFIFLHSQMLDSNGMPLGEKTPPEPLPDIEVIPAAWFTHSKPTPGSGAFSFLNILLRPKSRGTVRLTSSDPKAPLAIDPRYLDNQEDIETMRASIKFSLRLCDRMREEGYKMVDGHRPATESDEDTEAFMRQHARTSFHYSSSCRMAPEDDEEGGGVVDDELRVHGVRNLRIADSSVFPWVPATHLQAPSVAVAEKCAQMILAGAQFQLGSYRHYIAA